MKFNLIMLLLLCTFWVSAQDDYESGTVDNDIIFTTTDGETHSLFNILNSGKHLFITSFKYPG